MYSTCYYCPILMKLEFSQLIINKSFHINFMKIHTVGGKLFHAD